MNLSTPWKEEAEIWMPGVLNKWQMLSLIDANIIQGANNSIDDDASALDLHLTSEGYEMLKGSIKPFDKVKYDDIVKDSFYARRLLEDPTGHFSLKKTHCYLFKIKEKFHPYIKQSPIFGQATAKSTIGRIDVIARLIVDGMKEYEKFNPKEIGSGEMFLEITPITFDVKIKEGISISQLRFFNGEIESSIIDDKKFIRAILNLDDNSSNNGTLSVDVSNTKLANDKLAAALQANKKNVNPEIELWAKDKYSPKDFWNPVESSEKDGRKIFVIEKDEFYLLRSTERISLPSGCCIYCRAMDETLGEMRIHYAGFVHPRFGLNRPDKKTGTPLIFEVRGHNVKVALTQGEILARLFFYRMSKEVKPGASSYNEQELTPSKFFKKEWN